MPKDNVTRLSRAYSRMTPRARVLASLDAMRRGDAQGFEEIGRCAPTEIYRTASDFEAQAIEACCAVSELLDVHFLKASRDHYRACMFVGDYLADGFGDAESDFVKRMEAAADEALADARALYRAAHDLAAEIGIAPELVFARAYILNDPDFELLGKTETPDAERVQFFFDGLRNAWDGDKRHALTA